MKIPENISPEIAAYIKALQSENSKLQNEVSDLKTKVEKQELQISNLTEMLVNSRKKMFGKSSEKSKYFNDAQMSLFNEVEVCAEPSAPEPDKETFIAAHKRRKKRTKAELTENLNHIKQVCDLDKKECEICGGELTCIGEEFVRSDLPPAVLHAKLITKCLGIQAFIKIIHLKAYGIRLVRPGKGCNKAGIHAA